MMRNHEHSFILRIYPAVYPNIHLHAKHLSKFALNVYYKRATENVPSVATCSCGLHPAT